MIRTLSYAIATAALSGSSAFAGGPVIAGEEPQVEVVSSPAEIWAYYGSLSLGGVQFGSSLTQDISPSDPWYEGNMDFDRGTGFFGAFGYETGRGQRVELELSQMRGATADLSFPNAPTPFDVANTDGELRLSSAMINGWYTFGKGSIRPFVGAGLGVVHASIDTAFNLGGNNGIADGDSATAYMLGAGAELPISSRMSLLASYRFMSAGTFTMTDNEGTVIDADFEGHVLTLGSMFRF